jgi:hypothetical protein
MVNRKRMIVLAAVVIPSLVLAVLFFPTRERQVKKRFKVLREWVLVEGPEPPLSQVGKYREGLELFADPLELESESHGFSGKLSAQDAAGYAARWRSTFQTLDVEFKDIKVTFPGDEEALVTTTARLTGQSTGGTAFNETHELECALKKKENGWVFARIVVIQVLER